jgi:hypothetical protein
MRSGLVGCSTSGLHSDAIEWVYRGVMEFGSVSSFLMFRDGSESSPTSLHSMPL